MTEPKKVKMIKIVADYPSFDDCMTLWGVDFKAEGKERLLVATVDEETAKSLIDAKRAKAVK